METDQHASSEFEAQLLQDAKILLDNCKSTFDKADEDGSGTLDRKEITGLIKAFYKKQSH